MHRRYLRFPATVPALSKGRLVVHLVLGLVLFPFYWLAASIAGAPAMLLRWRFLWFGIRLLFRGGEYVTAYRCVVSPMDSVRHFEFDFFWRRARAGRVINLLDVSSPRLISLMLLDADLELRAHLMNPDAKDLARTKSIAKSMALESRCTFDSRRVGELSLNGPKYDLITCMSVLEHIVDDYAAVQAIWEMLMPGGRLLLSVPCAAAGLDEYSDLDEYGLLERDGHGFVFWQRYYDDQRLTRIFAITGKPSSCAIFGERVAGGYDADVLAKRSDPNYPHWRDCYATAKTYAAYRTLDELPGMGVIAMEFLKPLDGQAAGSGDANE